jgi:thioredoxin 1
VCPGRPNTITDRSIDVNATTIDKPIHVSDANFDRAVLKSPVPVVVDFWAPWCGPCRMVGPVLEKLAEEYAGRLIVAKVNVDDERQYAMQYGVQGIPTLLFVKDGSVVDSVVGFRPADVLKQKVEGLLVPEEAC